MKIDLLDGEVFVPVKDTCDNYFVSNKGRVYIVSKNRITKVNDNGAGYKTTCIYIKGSDRSTNSSRYIHRLVAEHFIPNPDGKKFVNHIDHDRSNNCVDNLEWCTAKENTAHGISHGRINAVKRGNTKQLTISQRINCVVMKLTGMGINEIAKDLGFPRTTISSVFNGRSNPELVEFAFSECEGYAKERLLFSLSNNEINFQK
jgi:hypothetical protein